MVDVVLLHSALGRAPGVHALGDALRAAGSRVLVPDLHEGATSDDP